MHYVIGSGLAGRFAAHLHQAAGRDVTLLHNLGPTRPKIIQGEFYQGPLGGMINWGGQVFLDTDHPAFTRADRHTLRQKLVSFFQSTAPDTPIDPYENDQGFGLLLPKNWCPHHDQPRIHHAHVTAYDMARRTVHLDDGTTLQADSIDLCLGAQSMIERDGDMLIFRPSRLDEIYDKALFYDALPTPSEQPIVLRKNAEGWRYEFRVNPQLPFGHFASSVVNLMHFKNGVLQWHDLRPADYIAGAMFLAQRFRNRRIYRSAMVTQAPARFTDPTYSLAALGRSSAQRLCRNTALHRHVYYGDPIIDTLRGHKIGGDYFDTGNMAIKAGSVGYKLLNVLHHFTQYQTDKL